MLIFQAVTGDNLDRIVVIGGGGHAKVLISIIKKNNDYEILGYTDIVDHGKILNVNYLGSDSILEKIFNKGECKYAALGIGQINATSIRPKIIKYVTSLGFKFPPIISPNSILNEDVVIGEGTVIFDGVIINSGTKTGKYNIINTSVVIDHDCEIGNFIHIASGANLCGGVKIGNNSMIGAGATILQYKKIVNNCMIGAGAVVVHNCDESGLYRGIPSKKIITQ